MTTHKLRGIINPTSCNVQAQEWIDNDVRILRSFPTLTSFMIDRVIVNMSYSSRLATAGIDTAVISAVDMVMRQSIGNLIVTLHDNIKSHETVQK